MLVLSFLFTFTNMIVCVSEYSDIQISNEELLEENELLLADQKELMIEIDSLLMMKENLIAVIFSLEVMMIYSEQQRGPLDMRSK